MNEIVVNLHMHTRYSDGYVTHHEIAQAAMQAGLDAVIVTDHNVWVDGPEDIYLDGQRRVLLLVGEEIHDQTRQPQKNHMLVLGAGRELAEYAYDPHRLIQAVRQAGGLCFIAHPDDPEGPAVHEPGISWVDWDVQGFTGLEVWNAMAEFKGRLKTMLHAIYYVFNPRRIAMGPSPDTLKRWDALLESGQRVVGVGGSDAHGFPVSLGPLHRIIFPYEFHFRTVNNHLLTDSPLTGDMENDRRLVLDALRCGRGFIGYDLPASTRDFHFTAHGFDRIAQMGEEIVIQDGVTLQIRLPHPEAECRLLRHGEVVQQWVGQAYCSYITTQPGAYRVEAYLPYQGQLRGWIFSNPIYLRADKKA